MEKKEFAPRPTSGLVRHLTAFDVMLMVVIVSCDVTDESNDKKPVCAFLFDICSWWHDSCYQSANTLEELILKR